MIQHEWGHGLDVSTRAGDGATGQGTADVVALHMSRAAQVGPGRSGDDIVLDWTADPTAGTSFAVYRVGGAGLQQAVRVGTTEARTFVHTGAATVADDLYYRVGAFDRCGRESPLR